MSMLCAFTISRVATLLRRDHFSEFRIVVCCSQPLVALFFRGISANVDEGFLGADA
jgi:hypothetical protein